MTALGSESRPPLEITGELLHEHIRGYTKNGIYSLIPLKYGTKKEPLVNWKRYQKRLPVASELSSWFSKPCNVAVVLGQLSGLVAIDIDSDVAKQRVERKLVEMGRCNNLRVSMLDSMMTLTGSGGFHFVFRVSRKLFEEYDLRTKLLWRGTGKHEEIKFLGEAHIAVLAPSLHPNGVGQYRWNGKAPIELSGKELKQLLGVFCEKYLPTTLDEHSLGNDLPKRGDDGGIAAASSSSLLPLNTRSSLSPNEIQKLITALKPRYTTGRRHTITLGYSGFMRKCGYTLQAVEEFCVIVCQTFNDEELEFRLRDVQDTFKKSIDKIAGWSLLNDIG